MELIEDIKILWVYLGRYKKAVLKTAVLAIVLAIIGALVPYIYGRLVDEITNI